MSGNQEKSAVPRFEPAIVTVQTFYSSRLQQLVKTGECEAFTDSAHLIQVRNVSKKGANTDEFIVSFMDWDGNDDGGTMFVRADFTLYLKWNLIDRDAIIAALKADYGTRN